MFGGNEMSLRKSGISLIFLALLCLLFYHVSFSQTTPEIEISPENFNFSFDVGRFRAQDNFVLVEIYYSIFRNYLKFVPEENGWMATFTFKAEIWQDDSVLTMDQWQNTSSVDSLEHITSTQKLFGLGSFAVEPGNYRLKVQLTDLNSRYEREKELPLNIESFATAKLAISDIELATRIQSNAEKNLFYKNGYMVIPNPNQFYGTGMPLLTFYSEIYNLCDVNMPDTANYSVQYRILDGDGQPVREFPPKVRKKPGESAVEASGMNIISFRSGTYFLELDVVNLANNERASKQKKFFIYREGDMALPDSTARRLAEEKLQASMERLYKDMPVAGLDQEFDAAKYIATKEEKKIFKTLDVSGKQAFLLEFWKRRDNTPETAQNEFRDDYLKLVNTANKEFSGFKDGYKSDRGRVLLMYGVPDEIERFPLNMEHKEHHIWKYFSIQGGVIFIFVDKQGFGSLELVHSTARGELSDPDWQRWINPNR
jgi:GWxTD domain-containing protein